MPPKLTHPKKMSDCLADTRPDMAVSLWLQDKAGHGDINDLPKEVVVAYRADGFLVEVNSGGFLGFFDWERSAAPETIEDLRAIDVPDVA